MNRPFTLGLTFIILSAIIVAGIVYQVWLNQQQKVNASIEEPTHVEKPLTTTPQASQTTTVDQDTTITIGMIGDILLHAPMYYYNNYEFAFAGVKDKMTGIDFLLANQESMPGGTELGLSTYPVFNSPKHILLDLKLNGVDFITMANNHTLDKGEQQVLNSIQHAKEFDLPYAGAYESPDDAATLRIENVKGIKIGVLAYTYGTNTYGTTHPDGKSYLVNIIDEERIINDIHTLQPHVDVVVLAMHWGKEYSLQESEAQRTLASRLTAAGADIIFGHHPHVLQPYETVNGKPVFYSLGNFYSAQPWPTTNIGGIGRVTMTKKASGEMVFEQANFFPTTVLQDVAMAGFKAKGFRIIPLENIASNKGYSAQWASNHVGLPSW